MINVNEETEYLEINNVVPVFRGNRIIKFVTSASIGDIHKVYDKLYYDEETQRGYKEVKNRNSIIKKRIESTKNITEMEEKMKSTFFDGGILTWNLRIDEVGDNKEYEYIPEELKLIVKSEVLTLPDSSQRHVAIYNLRKYFNVIDKDTYCFPLQICLYTLTEEKSLFSEINGEGTKASKTRALYLSNTYKALIIKDIINDSILKGNVETKMNYITGTDKLITFATLYNNIFDKTKGVYRHLDDSEVKEFKDWMVRFWNCLGELRPEIYGKLEREQRKEVRLTSLADSPMVMRALIVISKHLHGNRNWKNVLGRINKPFKATQHWTGDFFSLENPLWLNTVCSQINGKVRVNTNKTSEKFITTMLMKHLNIIEG